MIDSAGFFAPMHVLASFLFLMSYWQSFSQEFFQVLMSLFNQFILPMLFSSHYGFVSHRPRPSRFFNVFLFHFPPPKTRSRLCDQLYCNKLAGSVMHRHGYMSTFGSESLILHCTLISVITAFLGHLFACHRAYLGSKLCPIAVINPC